jgi:hypothetical protein
MEVCFQIFVEVFATAKAEAAAASTTANAILTF